MTSDIREQAARVAREWRGKQRTPDDILHDIGEAAYEMGYLAGYEAAKAEAAEELEAVWKATDGGSHD